MHSTERHVNVERTLRAFLEGLTITGTPEFRYPNDPRKAPAGPWVRVSFDFPGGQGAGHIGGAKATQAALTLILDVFVPTLEDVASGSLDTLGLILDDLCAAFRYKLLDLADYSSDPLAPTTVSGHPLRFPAEPTKQPLLPEDLWFRARLTFRGFWHLRQAA